MKIATAKSEKPYADLAPTRIAELAALLPEQPRGLGEPCHNRPAWEVLAKNKNFAAVINSAATQLGQGLPPWSDDLYLDFSRTGRRPAGEKMMDDRREKIRPLVWAECLENKGRFIPDIEKILLAYTDEPSWTRPAHDPELKNFNGTAYSVDLQSSKLAHELAQALWLLGDKVSAGTRAKVIATSERRIFTPLRESFRTGTGTPFLYRETNWNSVCLAGSVGAALTMLPDRNDRALFAAAGEYYSRFYLAGFTSDGYCSEGLGYWNYGMSHFLLLREQLWQATGGKVELFSNEKVRNVALYGINIEMINGAYPAIADCQWGTKPEVEFLSDLSQALNLGLHHHETAWDPAIPRDLIFAPMEIFPNSFNRVKTPNPESKDICLRSFFEQAGVLVCRTASGATKPMSAVLKGGHNDEPHNHNDIGSFTLVYGKEVLVADPGGPTVYNSRTFSAERYTIKLFTSLTHSVPVVAGRAQIPSRNACTKVLKTDFTEARDEIVMDITSAYDAPELKKLVRTFIFDRRAGSLTVQDDFEFSRDSAFELALTTRASWKQITANQIELTAGSECAIAEIQAPCAIDVTSEIIAEDCLPFTRLGLKLKQPLSTGKVVVTFRTATTK